MDEYRSKGFALSLFIICICGVLGILIDLDHLAIPTQQILALLSGGVPSYASRPAHIYCFIVGGIVWIVANALVLRLLYKIMVMRGRTIGEIQWASLE